MGRLVVCADDVNRSGATAMDDVWLLLLLELANDPKKVDTEENVLADEMKEDPSSSVLSAKSINSITDGEIDTVSGEIDVPPFALCDFFFR